MNGANIIVLSSSLNTKLALADKFKGDPELKPDITVANIAAAQLRFVKNAANILVLDTDSNEVEYRYIKMLTEKHWLYVITFGKTPKYNLDPSIQFVPKPVSETSANLEAFSRTLAKKIKDRAVKAPNMSVRDLGSYVDPKQKLIAIASSTGGTEALPVVLGGLPADAPPVIIVQHMPSVFTRQLALRIDKMSAITVKEAENGEFIKRGTAYIAPGDLHMRMALRQQKLILECFYGEKMHGVRPAADILFDSVASISGANAVGVILTGMGSDGARGLMEMRRKGAKVVGQDKESSVVYGMPRAAFELGAVDVQAPLDAIAGKIMKFCGIE
jgi:two-component system chemotaxis response regulator CheB